MSICIYDHRLISCLSVNSKKSDNFPQRLPSLQSHHHPCLMIATTAKDSAPPVNNPLVRNVLAMTEAVSMWFLWTLLNRLGEAGRVWHNYKSIKVHCIWPQSDFTNTYLKSWFSTLYASFYQTGRCVKTSFKAWPSRWCDLVSHARHLMVQSKI